MADAVPNTPEADAAPSPAPAPAKKKGLPLKLLTVVGGVVLVQGALLFGLFKFLGGGPQTTQAEPSSATSADHGAAPAEDDHGKPAVDSHGKPAGDGHGKRSNDGHGEPAASGGHGGVPLPPGAVTGEVQLVKGFRVPNDKSGRMYIYDLEVSIVVPADQVEAFRTLATTRLGEVQDRIGRVVRSATDKMLREDDLEMLRAQIREELSEMLGDGQRIDRVLIPRLVPLPT